MTLVHTPKYRTPISR